MDLEIPWHSTWWGQRVRVRRCAGKAAAREVARDAGRRTTGPAVARRGAGPPGSVASLLQLHRSQSSESVALPRGSKQQLDAVWTQTEPPLFKNSFPKLLCSLIHPPLFLRPKTAPCDMSAWPAWPRISVSPSLSQSVVRVATMLMPSTVDSPLPSIMAPTNLTSSTNVTPTSASIVPTVTTTIQVKPQNLKLVLGWDLM